MKTKTASVRLPKEMYQEIDNVCNDIGCSRNDWIKETLRDKLRTQLDENTQDNEQIPTSGIIVEDVKKPKPEIIIKEIPEPTIEFIPELRNIRVTND